MEHFGTRIRELRKERGIKSSEMAMRLGISRNTLINWEHGDKVPHSVEILETMAEILNVSMIELLAGKLESELENNPTIRNLSERVTRLEQLFNRYLK